MSQKDMEAALYQLQGQLRTQAVQQQQLQQQLAVAQAAAPTVAHAPAPVAVPHAHRVKIPAASNFAGTANHLDGWLREMRQQFDYYEYNADTVQVAMAAAQLRGSALDWWAALSSPEQSPLRSSFVAFEQALRARFQPINSAQTARLALDSLRQGAKQSVADYISSFRRLLVAVPDMSDADKVHRFVQGLRCAIQQPLIVHGVDTLDKAIAMASRVGSLGLYAASSAAAAAHSHGDAMDLSNIEGLEQQTDENSTGDPAAPVTRAELQAIRQLSQQQFKQLLNAMQYQRGAGAGNRGGKRPPFGRGDHRGPPRVPGLSDEQVRERLDGNLCFMCGEAGHRKYDCPQNKQKNQSGN